MRYDLVSLGMIEPDPKNVRQYFHDDLIEDLADSIHTHGLLQNLVVREHDKKGRFYLVGGERRYRALHKLVERGHFSLDFAVPVMVIDGEGTFENLVENLGRVDVSPWDLGHKFAVLLDSGFTQLEIAARLGKDQGYVSRMTSIAKGLHPAVITKLNKLGQNKLSTTELIRVSALHDGSVLKKPDEKSQMSMLEELLGVKKHRKRKPMKRTDAQLMIKRLQHIRLEMVIPRHAQPYVDELVKYLMGEINGRQIKWPEEL